MKQKGNYYDIRSDYLSFVSYVSEQKANPITSVF